MSLRLITPPTVYPVSLTEAKLFCKVDNDAEDPMLTRMIMSATSQAENIIKRRLITQTWELTLDSFVQAGRVYPHHPGYGCVSLPYGWNDRIELPYPPVESIVSVEYLDENGDSQTVDVADYYLQTTDPAVLLPAVDFNWPATYSRADAVTVQYVAGYGYAGELVPEDIRSWIMLRVGTLYEHRSQFIASRVVSELDFVDGLLDPYKIITIA